MTKHVFTTLGPIGIYAGPRDRTGSYPPGWWLVLSNGYYMRYEHVLGRLYRRVVLERYPVVLRKPRATGAQLRRWRRGGAL